MLLVVGGMIGLGKTSVAEILGRHFNSEVFYESVDDNPILPLFYTNKVGGYMKFRLIENGKEINCNIVLTFRDDNNVLDRSIYEDWYFAKVNNELGRISDLEFKVYDGLLNNMMEELEELPKKAPDLMIYLKGSFETVLSRIMKRGRSYELDEHLEAYYHKLWSGYDAWVMKHYKASDVLIIDMDQFDVVGKEEDAQKLIALVEEKLKKQREI